MDTWVHRNRDSQPSQDFMIQAGSVWRAKKAEGKIPTFSVLRSNPRCAGLWVTEANWSKCVGLHVGVNEDPGGVQGQAYGRTDRELSPIASRREMGDDLPIVYRQRHSARVGYKHHRWH